MCKFISKNQKIVYGILAFFMMATAVFIWNSYQVEISEKPVKPPAIISRECGIEQCHGLDLTCGPNIAKECTMEMRIDDFCREYVRCEKVGRECQLIKEPKFEECKACIERCNQEEDPEKAFQCASRCGETEPESLLEVLPERIIFNNQVYIPAKCVEDPSAKVKKVGVSQEGISVFTGEIPKDISESEQGILVQRNDGYYQCYTLSPNEVPFESIVKNDGMTNSYGENPEEYVFAVVTEEKDYVELWKKMYPSDEQLQPWGWSSLIVDFKRDDVVVVMSDRKSSLCCSVEVKKIYLLDNQNLLIEVEETQPGRGCNVSDVISRPYHLVRIAKTSYQKIEDKITVVQNPRCD